MSGIWTHHQSQEDEDHGLGVSESPSINISDYTLAVVEEFRSTISNNLSLDLEFDMQFGRATAAIAKLSKRVRQNDKLTTATKFAVYRACVLSTLLYGRECWMMYTCQQQCLNNFHLHCLHASWAYLGKTMSLTRTPWNRQTFPACLPCSSICTGLAMCTVCTTTSPKTYCTENSLQVPGQQEVQCCVTRMCASGT